MKLYLITAETEDGDSYDLVVAAETVEQARILWIDFYALTIEDLESEWIKPKFWRLPTEIPGAAGVITWESMEA